MKKYYPFLSAMASIALAFSMGAGMAKTSADKQARLDIANDCQQTGHFTVNRRGFECGRLSK